MATVTCGSNILSGAQFDGKSIATLAYELKGTLGIPDEAMILINGEEAASGEYITQQDDEIEWVKKSGTKG